jgi:IS605 OrfB family transposase
VGQLRAEPVPAWRRLHQRGCPWPLVHQHHGQDRESAALRGKECHRHGPGAEGFAATSSGEKVKAERFYRDQEAALAIAQRARKKARARAIHAKIAHRRKDFLHKLSTRLVAENGAIFVGNVNSAGLARTRMAKSVFDAGWSTFRTMLQYKCDDAGVWFDEVDEAYSTQTCSACDARSGPRGLEGLGIREWSCSCGAVHDRDVNAARIILARGLARLAGGTPFLSA